MSLEQTLTDTLTQAIRAKDTRTADVVRMLKSRLTERRTSKGFTGEVDDAHEVEHHVALPLARRLPGHLLGRQPVPLAVPGADGVRPVGLGEAVDVHGPEAQIFETAQQGRRGRGAGHRAGHRVGQPASPLLHGESLPAGLPLADRIRSVHLGKSVDVDDASA